MDEYVEIIRSNKGGLKLIHKGYMYTVHKKRQSGGIRWRCTQRGLHCKGSISTGYGPPKINMAHNHIPDPHSVALARCRQLEEYTDVTPFLETEYDEIRESLQTSVKVEPNKSSPPAISKTVVKPATTIKPTTTIKPITTLKPATTIQPAMSQESINEEEVDSEEVCLRWNSHYSNMKKTFPYLLHKERYTDCTLTTDKGNIKCHQLILSSCSAYFDKLLSGISRMQHPVIFMKGVKHWIVKALIDFMYIGEIHIEQTKLPDLLEIAESLQIKGLTGKGKKDEKPETIKQEIKTEDTRRHDEEQPSTSKATSTPKPVIITKLPYKEDALLAPAFYEEASNDSTQKFKDVPAKKPPPKKIKKRKIEHELSPPPLLIRKGTKSRPNVKMPKHYHNDYEAFDIKKPTSSLNSSTVSSNNSPPPLTPAELDPPPGKDVIIKLEPLDIDDNLIEYDDPLELTPANDDVGNDTVQTNQNKQENNTTQEQNEPKVFQKIKIIKVHPESLLKSNQMKIPIKISEDPLKISEDKSGNNKNS